MLPNLGDDSSGPALFYARIHALRVRPGPEHRGQLTRRDPDHVRWPTGVAGCRSGGVGVLLGLGGMILLKWPFLFFLFLGTGGLR